VTKIKHKKQFMKELGDPEIFFKCLPPEDIPSLRNRNVIPEIQYLE
jgi:hypothetical protein